MLLKFALIMLIARFFMCREICYDDFDCFESSFNLISEKPIFNLPESPAKINTTFLLFNRHLPTSGHIAASSLDTFTLAHLPVKIIIHGMFNRGDTPWVLEMKDTLLKNQDVNVVIVDWHMGSRGMYAVI
jgi:hypothetical protein